jgi:hypothetical protein
MVIDDLHIKGVTAHPTEAYPPLIVDPNAVLPATVTLEHLEPIARRVAEIFKRRGTGKQFQLPPRRSLNRPKSPHVLIVGKSLCGPASKCPDHPIAL